MLIWIVNPFDPLPGDPEQEGRYATLARLLAARGHQVTWWTSSFSHRFKRPVDQSTITAACRRCGIQPRFIPAPPYARNVGLARLRNHAVLARNFRRLACAALRKKAGAAPPQPDVVIASTPPPGLAWAATQVARQHGAKVILDVQDCWPDNFAGLAPHWARPLVRPVLVAMRGSLRRAAAHCDAIVGVADAYVEYALRVGRRDRAPAPARGVEGKNDLPPTRANFLTATIPLGVDLAAFDQAAAAGRCPEFTKPSDQVWLAYSGSLTRAYDFLTILHAAARVRDRLGSGVRFFLTSRGELAGQAAQLVRDHGLTTVSLTGFLPFPRWAYLLTQCDAGFNACRPGAMIFLPNKIFYYLAAGLVVLNTIPGQCSRIVREAACGLDYQAGDVEGCAAAIEQVVRDASERARMRRAARRLAETTYDRAVLFPRYAELIEQLPAWHRSSAG